MALEISEIGIRMRVGRDDDRQSERQAATSGCQDVDRDELVADCVRKVLRLLKSEEGR